MENYGLCLFSSIKTKRSNLTIEPFSIWKCHLLEFQKLFEDDSRNDLQCCAILLCHITMKTSVKRNNSHISTPPYEVLKNPKETQNFGVLYLTFLHPKESSQLSISHWNSSYSPGFYK